MHVFGMDGMFRNLNKSKSYHSFSHSPVCDPQSLPVGPPALPALPGGPPAPPCRPCPPPSSPPHGGTRLPTRDPIPGWAGNILFLRII